VNAITAIDNAIAQRRDITSQSLSPAFRCELPQRKCSQDVPNRMSFSRRAEPAFWAKLRR